MRALLTVNNKKGIVEFAKKLLIRACQEQANISACKTSFNFFIRAVVLRT